MGRLGDFKSRTRAADRAGQGADGLVLRNHALVQLFFHAQQLLCLFFLDGGHGHAGPAAYHFLNVLAGHNAGGGLIQVIFLAQGAQVLALLALFVGVETRLFELMVRNGVLHPVNDKFDPLLDFRNFFRK